MFPSFKQHGKPSPASPITKFAKRANPQLKSRLMQLPTEVRLMILSYLISPPKVLYSWLDRDELAKQHAQHQDALLIHGLDVSVSCCCQMLLDENRTILYGNTTLRIRCEWTENWSRVAISGGRLVFGCATYIRSERANELDIFHFFKNDRKTGVPSLKSLKLFRKFEIAMIDNFLDPAFSEICRHLKNIVAGKDVVITIRRPFPAAALDCFDEWQCKSVVVKNTDIWPELKGIKSLIDAKSLMYEG